MRPDPEDIHNLAGGAINIMFRLLLADDHAAMREKAIRVLEVDYSVIDAVSNGQEILDAESRTSPDAVILDISMPIMTGLEAATRLKQRGSAAKIIFLTVHEEVAFLRAALDAGAVGYVTKLRLATDLCLAVEEAMAGRIFVSPPLSLVKNGHLSLT